MSKKRMVDTRFWKDGWVRSINPLDRYLFLYLITNSSASWCGVYELPLDIMAAESGIDRDELKHSMLPKLAPKVIYIDGWIYIPNWIKYHLSDSGSMSPQQQKGYDEAWKGVPENIRLRIREIEAEGIPYVYPMGGVSPSASTIASTSTDEAKASSSFAEANSNAHSKSTLGTISKVPLDPQDGGERPAKVAKPRETWAAERKVFESFAAKVKRELGVDIMSPSIFQLKRIRSVMNEKPNLDLDDLFEDWFTTNRKDEEYVQIHFALGGPNITRYLATNS